MNISTFLISALIFTGITIGMISFYSNAISPYGVAISSSNMTNTTAEINSLNEDIKARVTSISDKGLSYTSLIDSVVLVVDVIKSFVQVPNIISGIIEDISMTAGSNINVPLTGSGGWFKVMIGSIVTLIIVFTVAAIFMKRGSV